MLGKLYAKWMYAWETALTTRDTNRIVRPLEWGEDWLADFIQATPLTQSSGFDHMVRLASLEESGDDGVTKIVEAQARQSSLVA